MMAVVVLLGGDRHQRRHAVHDHHVNRSAADQRLGDVQGVFSAVGLGDGRFPRTPAEGRRHYV